MANLHDKANAIWKALDDMANKDPETYQKFIQEQLQEGAEFFKSQSKTSTTASTTAAGAGDQSAKMDQLMANMFGKFSGLGMGLNNGKKYPDHATTSGLPSPLKSQASAEKNNYQSTSNIKDNLPKSNQSSLLDDTIGSSVIASIISDETKSKLEKEQNSADDGLDHVDIRLPSDEGIQSKKKPLIEEL